MAAQAQLPLVLRLPREERNPDPEFVLLHVSGDGSGDLLDLKLVGTDSSEVFAYSLKHSRTSKLKSKNTNISQEDWEAVLAAILLGQVPEDQGDFQGLEAVTKVVGETSMKITIQKKIEGITQLFGQIVLKYTEDEEINPFDWACLTIESKDSLKSEIAASRASAKEKDEQIRKLEETISEFTTLKKQNEDHLIEKFALLLNEKKLKVRNQQRILATANIDPSKLPLEEDDEMDVEREVSAGPSRPRKRKAGTVVEEEDSDEDVKMAVDEPEVELDSDEADRQTASETESDSDTNTMPSSAPKAAAKSKAVSPPKAKAVSPPRRRTRGASAQPEKKPDDDFGDDGMPPKRALPFQRKAPAKKPAPLPTPVEGSETESETDEL